MIIDNERYVDYLDFSALCWKRPKRHPRVWRVVDGRKKTAKNGQIPRFSIQEVPEELEDDVVDFMVKYFVPEEPIHTDTGIGSEPLGLREVRTRWTAFVRQGVSVVALVVNSDPVAKPTIAGVNLLNVIIPDIQGNSANAMKIRSRGLKRIMNTAAKFYATVDVRKHYGVDKYLNGLGLSVHPSFRGQGLGEELLRARDDIGLAYQIPVSTTFFTATASQILARRVGYEVLGEQKFTEILDDEEKPFFPGLAVGSVKFMGKRLY